MFAPQSLTDFPRLGDLSIGRYSVPTNSGTTPVTELRNILDTRWSMDSLDRAVDLARGSTSDFNSSCLSGNGLWNPDGSAFGIGGRSGLSLTGLDSVLGRGADSLLGTIGDLQIAGTLQSLASGLARSISSMAGAMFGILDRALSATGSVAQGLMGLAGKLVDAAARAVDLFSGAFQLAANGLTGLGGLDLGEALSGGLGKLAGLAGAGLESLVGGVGSLLSNVGSLASDLMSHGIDALLSPMASLSQLSSLFSPITGALSSLAKGVGDAMSSLNLETLSKVASKLGEALAGVLGDLTGALAGIAGSLMDGITRTFERLQGLKFIDGEWDYSFPLSSIGDLGLKSLLGEAGRSWRPNAGTFGSTGTSASRVLLAALLGSSSPVKGSFLATNAGGWLGSPVAALGGMSGALSEACAFNAALRSALSHFLSSGSSAIDALMAALECRRSTYNNIGDAAGGAGRLSQDLLNRLLGLLGVMGAGNYGDACASNGLAPGVCV